MFSRRNGGFTLIELLISITLVGVILVIVLGAFRIGIRAWETGERDIEKHQRQQIVLSLIKRQLASVVWYKIRKPDENPFYFRGDSKSVECVSGIAISPGNAFGNVFVNYRIVSGSRDNTEALEVFEQNIAGTKPDVELFETNEEAYHELLTDAYEIFFEYLKTNETEETQWQADWDPGKDKGLPEAVRLSLQLDEDSAPVTVMSRIQGEKTDS